MLSPTAPSPPWNGESAGSVTYNNTDGTLTLTYTFPETDAVPLVSIEGSVYPGQHGLL